MLWVVSPPLELCKETMAPSKLLFILAQQVFESPPTPHMHHIVQFNHSLGDKFCPQNQSEFFHFQQTAGESKDVFFVKLPVLVLQFLKCLLYSEERLRHSREPAQTQARYPAASPSGRWKRGEWAEGFLPLLEVGDAPVHWTSDAGQPLASFPLRQLHVRELRHQRIGQVQRVLNLLQQCLRYEKTQLVFKAFRKRKRKIHRR